MKYCDAIIWVQKLNDFRNNLKEIDINKADEKRDGAYTVAIKELELVLNSQIELEDIFFNPDNVLRNIIMLSHLDKNDNSTKK